MDYKSSKQELLQSQKTRDELMKWKLLLVAAIGSVGLGSSSTTNMPPHSELALAIIPFVCCYVDLLCRNLSVRTKLLSRFLAAELKSNSQEDPTIRFEEFYRQFDAKRNSAEERKFDRRVSHRDALEGLALINSTRLLSGAVIGFGIFNFLIDIQALEEYKPISWESLFLLLFVISGVIGLLSSSFVEREYNFQRRLIEKTGNDWK